MRALIVAMADNRLIGRENGLPWHLPADLAFFKRTTMGKAIIMGRRTHESIGRSLPGRLNIVVSRQQTYRGYEGSVVTHSLEDAFQLSEANDIEPIIIGGVQLYQQALPWVERLYVTHVQATLDGDAFFPELDWREWLGEELGVQLADERHEYNCRFMMYRRVLG
ncbi:MAG TPA: dihydrofolate reductase [Gammaproteobacteria bacterium]|nr:dihydrofolate reductase [Gammaproteobacteria bacterium]